MTPGATALALAAAAALGLQSPQEPATTYSPKIEPASDEGRAAIGGLKVAKGFTVGLWAAEPRLANPVCLYVTDQGDVYVAETFRHYAGVTDIRDHMDWLDEDMAAKSVADRVAMMRAHSGERFGDYTKESERVRLLRDMDGDGTADFDAVFADGFDDPAAGIGAGLLDNGGYVYFTCIPDLWLLHDADGDGRAEIKKRLSGGYGVHVAFLGHDLHGLRIGPDGKLYFSCGDRGLHVETEPGVVDNVLSGSVLRCNLDGTELELFATGLRNPQELAFDELGNLFTGDNNSDGGDEARWVNVVEGADSGWRYSYQYLTEPWLRGPWNDEGLWKPHFDGQAAYILPPIANLAHGPSGLCYHPGTGLSTAYQKHFFLVDFEGDPRYSGILSFTHTAKGASFELGPVEEFVWNCLPTDVDFGPDGALYWCDWVFGWQKPNKGRVYRIRADPALADPAAATTRELLSQGMRKRTPAELGALLRNADQRVRQAAELELAGRGAQGLEALSEAAKNRASFPARLAGIWGLGILARRDATVAALLRPLLDDADPEARAQGARVLGDLRDKASAQRLIALCADPAARTRMYSALALGRIRVPSAVPALCEILRGTGQQDPTLRHAAIFGLAGCASPEQLLALAGDASADVRIGAVVALRRQGAAGPARFLADADARVRLEAARAIYDVPAAQAELPALAQLAARTDLGDGPLARRALHASFRLGGDERARLLADVAARAEGDPRLRREALDLLARWEKPPGRDAFTGAWRPLEPRDPTVVRALVPALRERGITSAPDDVRAAWIALVGRYKIDECMPTVLGWASDATQTPKLRAAALAALGEIATTEAVDALRGAVLDPDGEVRAAALAAIQKAAPGEALPILKNALASADPRELRAVYQGLAKVSDAEAEAVLFAETQRLAADLVPQEVALDLVLAAETKKSERIDALLAARTQARAADPDLAPFLDGLWGGDAAAGEKLFREKTELTCLKCHRTAEGAEGGNVGPVLAGVGKRVARLKLAESITAPNRAIAKGYQGTLLVLADERVIEGRVLSADDAAVRVLDAEGQTIEIPRSEVVNTRAGLSAMPQGLAQHLSRTEMRDLIEYLASL